jgi:carbamoyl-phosphate synthase large subunit
LYPGWLIDEYIFQKEISFFSDWTSNLMMLRYDAHVLVANVG